MKCHLTRARFIVQSRFVMPATTTIARPETFRLPKPGVADPYFGFSRSFYYAGEQRGYWKLVRIRDGGKLKGVTLIPFEQVAAFVRAQIAEQNGVDTNAQIESTRMEKAEVRTTSPDESEQKP